MKLLLLATAALAFGIASPIPVLDRWQADFREQLRAGIKEYLPSAPQSAERRALLRELCAIPDSDYGSW
jgi:hypothetical protein